MEKECGKENHKDGGVNRSRHRPAPPVPGEADGSGGGDDQQQDGPGVVNVR